MTKHYINLSNGILAVPKLKNWQAIRIQSTACEQKRWDFILQDLDNGFLLDVALGHKCIIYGFGKNGNTRALWQGLEWIRYALSIRWFDTAEIPVVRGHNVSNYFSKMLTQCSERTLKKIDCFRKFAVGKIDIEVVYDRTSHDGNYEYFRETLNEHR